MLYLNKYILSINGTTGVDLTLTNVVFEFIIHSGRDDNSFI